MIKKLFLAAALLLCAAEGMAQERTLLEGNYVEDDDDAQTTAVYDIYSDGAVLKKYHSHVCNQTIFIPASVKYKGETYQLVEISDNVFYNENTSSRTFGQDVWKITIDNKAVSTLKFGESPLGNPNGAQTSIDLEVSPCLDAAKWKNDFSVVQYLSGLDNATITEITKPYDGTPDLDLSAHPCTVTAADYTLSITKAQNQSLSDIYVNTNSTAYKMRAIEYSVIDKDNQTVCTVTGGDLEFDKEIVRITPADCVLSTDRIIALTDAQYYPSLDDNDNVKIISTHLVSDNKNELFTYLTNECRFLQYDQDTAIVECTVKLSADGNEPCLLISIPQGASCQAVHGYTDVSGNYKGTPLTQDYKFKLKLNGDKVKLYLTDNANIDHQVETYCNKTFNSYALAPYIPGLFGSGSSTPTQVAVYTLPSSLTSSLSKAYDNSATYTDANVSMPEKINFHIAYDLNRYELENNLYERYKNNAGTLSSLKTNYNIYQNRTIDIPVDAELVFVDDNGKKDLSIGDNKKVKLVLTPTGPDADFYKALLENTEIDLDGYTGSITPKQLSSTDIKGIEDDIEKYISNPKYFDNTPNVNMSVASSFTYTTADKLDVTVTITDAKYYNKGAEVSEVGKNYDIKVSYKVDDNFYISTEQAGGYVRSQTLTLNNGAILSECSPDNQEIENILADLERNSAFEGQYTGASSREWSSTSVSTASATYLVEVTGITTVDGDNNKAPVSDVKYDDNGDPSYWSMIMQYQIKDQSGNVCYDKNSTGYSDLYVQASGASTQSGKGFKITPATKLSDALKQLIQQEYVAQLGKTKEYDGTTDIATHNDILPVTFENNSLEFTVISAAYNDANAGTGKTITVQVTNPNFSGTPSVTVTDAIITKIQLDNYLSVRYAIYDALGEERNKPYDGSSKLVPDSKTVTIKKADTGLPDDVEVVLSQLEYFDQNSNGVGGYPTAEHGKHTIIMALEVAETGNYCFHIRGDETVYTENWSHRDDDRYTGQITPVEINLTEEMFAVAFPTERQYDGTTLVYDHAGKTVNAGNPQMFLADPKYMVNGNFEITNAVYKSADVSDPNSIILTINNVTGNYIIKNLGDGNTFAISGKITPAEFTVTAAMFDGLFKTEKTYDGNTNVFDKSDKAINANNVIDYKESGQTIFKVTAAQYKDATAAEQKDITLTLGIVSANYTLASNTFTLKNGKITPAELTVTASMFDGLFKTEKTYDGNTNVFDNTDKAINTNNPVDYKESGQTIFKVTAAQYKDATAAEQKDITLTLGIVSTNYTLASNTFTLKNGKITPAEFTVTAAMFDGLFKTEKTYDGNTNVYDNSDKAINTNNPVDYKESGQTIFKVTAAQYKDEKAAKQKDITLTLGIVSTNYTLASNTFTLKNGKITPAELSLTFAAEDFNNIIELQRQFNADDPSAKVKTNEITKGDNTFIIKSAEYKENTVGDNKEIVITVELNDPNFTLKNPTFSLTNGTIWDYAAIDLNDLEFNEGSAEIGKDITASATYNGEPVAGTFTYTPSAGTQLTKGTHTVKVEFAPQSSYIKAPATVPSFDVKVKGVIVVDQNSIRQKDNLDAYCLDAVGNLMLEYSKVIGNIKTYQIEVEGFESLSQSGDIADGSIIYITLPADVLPGRYNGTIQFFGEDEESDKYPFTIDIYLPRDIVKQLYSDVLFADNHESLYVGYQWFKNGKAISGADRQFYHEANLSLSDKYTVEVKTKSGISLHSCPLDAANAVTKRALSDVKVYPNPAKAGIPFTLELVGGDNDFSDTEIQIYNNSGTLVQRVTNVDKTITLTLPRGNYSGALIRHGEKSGFKIIVE